jgi:xanthine dehydrogenase iron-sulfur cluster and FAD-binding subunit A
MWQTYVQPTSLPEALDVLREYGTRARIVAGATDLLVELQRGVKPTTMLIDISKLNELKYVRDEDDWIALGALTTHNDVLLSEACQQYALPLVQACGEVGAPPIRTRATIAGNIITGSPANDTIAPLLALGAQVILLSAAGERSVSMSDFYPGMRRTVLQADEILREIRFPKLSSQQRGLFIKLGLRRSQAISVINMALVLTFDTHERQIVRDAQITLGCLAPLIIHAETVEKYLRGKQLDTTVCLEAGQLALQDVRPIGDVRASASYRLDTLSTLLTQALERIAANDIQAAWMQHPVSLETERNRPTQSLPWHDVIVTTINGRGYEFAGAQQKTLLNALREDAGLIGTKEGCAEGECGACAVWLNGQAVMSCLVPAAQAHGAHITTIEGLADGERLHPLQQAFIDQAAVQCGFCIPGMLMAGAKLLAEHPHPDSEQIRIALGGNICRCTGYRKILDAVASVGERTGEQS